MVSTTTEHFKSNNNSKNMEIINIIKYTNREKVSEIKIINI
jgi:hypothetical protein